MIDYRSYYDDVIDRQKKWASFITSTILVIFIAATAAKDAPVLMFAGSAAIIAGAYGFYAQSIKKYRTRLRLLGSDIPSHWHTLLREHSVYYSSLSEEGQKLFAQRVAFLLADVQIDGIDTEADDTVKLLVAASAVIPTFALPYFDYPNLRNVLVYSDVFNERFQTDIDEDDEMHNSGMVGTGFLNYTVLLSRRDLLAGFSGMRTRRNVGIHEFVHLLDKADGAIDGVPAILMDHASIPSWLELVGKEMNDIERGRSDIDPYALTDQGEFFAVVCEYFFNSPERCRENHPELFDALCLIFHQDPSAVIIPDHH